ncbi:MAG: hypothetical protein ACFFC7_13680 [Candidatus Hermodarchaeota archaeon]
MAKIPRGVPPMQAVLQGQIITPIITKRTTFHLEGCRFTITRPRRRYINKITAGVRMYPYSFIGYVGEIEARYTCSSKAKAKRKLDSLITIKQIGQLRSEGMGQVKWLEAKIEQGDYKPRRPTRKIKIRKGLPHNLPESLQKLVKYSILHDFYNTGKHRSKIYVEPELDDTSLVELLRQHHEQTKNPMIQTFQHYDRRAAIITRKVKSPRPNRYNWKGKDTIDFEKLAKEIKEVAEKSVWKLYEYVYQSKELNRLTESMEHGHSSLRRHLILITNLIVQDFYKGKL